jgi:hypothetical protein
MRLRCLVVFAFALQLLGLSFAVAAYALPQEGPQQNASGSARSVGAPVVVGGKTLFYVPARMFTFSPEDRAKIIAERVEFTPRTRKRRRRSFRTMR